MFTILGLLVILIWFYLAAKEARKSKVLWMSIGFILYMFLGVLFLKFTEMYILQTDTIAEVYKYRVPKMLLQFVSFLIILVASYGVQSKFLKRKTS